MIRPIRRALAAAIVVFLAASCGSGNTVLSEGGIGGTGISAGRVSGFGSVFVNGIEYDTAGAEIRVDGMAGSEGDLDVGMVVTVEGSASGAHGVATRVSYARQLVGPVASNGTNAAGVGVLRVLGRRVQVEADTTFVPLDAGAATVAEVPVDALVEVSGYPLADGYFATRIAVQPAGTTYRIAGSVSDHAGSTFRIGTLTVDYSSAALPDGAIADGMTVTVSSDRGLDAQGRLLADSIGIGGVDPVLGADGAELELEGVVTATLVGDTFELNGLPVRIVAATEIEHGTRADLVSGAVASAEGVVQAGTLVAEAIELRADHERRYELRGTVEAVDVAGDTLTVLGQVVHVDAATLFEDDLYEERYFRLDDLRPGLDYVEVALYAAGDTWRATAVTRDEAEDESEVRGRIEAILDQRVRVVGVVVDVSAVQGTFAVGDYAEFEGAWSGFVLFAESGEVEDEDEDGDGDGDGEDDD